MTVYKKTGANIIIVSGRSGSGKTSVLNILEDFGYHAIDNMPLSLLPKVADKLIQENQITKVALGVDVRTPNADLSNFKIVLDNLISKYGNDGVKVYYVTAKDPVLVARFAATRRVHPLMVTADNPIIDLSTAIQKEIELLKPISAYADIEIDTSSLNTHQLKTCVREHVGFENKVLVNLLSFGFKYGIAMDADFIFNVRILPNPHWQPELRAKTGMDKEVAAFFNQYPEVEKMQQDIYGFLTDWLPQFLSHNQHSVTIAIGCTGGKHRSVFIVNNLYEQLTASLPDSFKVTYKHREKPLW